MNKLKSRKFIAYLIGIVFVAATIYITKTITPELINFMIFNQLFYAGGNTLAKYIDNKKP